MPLSVEAAHALLAKLGQQNMVNELDAQLALSKGLVMIRMNE